MDISYQWLQAFLPGLPAPDVVAERLTACGLEVESVTPLVPIPGGLEGVVTGLVISAEKHPDADKLRVCQVEVGGEAPLGIVCGAPNVAAGQTVLVALPGATLYPAEGEHFKIKKSKIRGVESNGMICADDELGLGTDHSGIRVLEEAFSPGTPAAQALNLMPDYIFSIGLTPNRADAASHWGVARDLSLLFGLPVQFPDAGIAHPVVADSHSVHIEAAQACGLYTLQRIEGIQFGPSGERLRKPLQSVGQQTLNAPVDITNYVLLGYGQPMHAFDADKVQLPISVRFARAGERLVTLAGSELTLLSDDLIIADASGPIALAGVIGGRDSAVSESTRAILLETAWFHPDAVRKTARNHQLNTEASFRFVRGTDPQAVNKCRELALALFQSECGGTLSGPCLQAVGVLPEPAVVSFSIRDFYRLAGIEIPEAEILRILTGLEIQVEATGTQEYRLTIPLYRVDVRRPQDVYEDILRIYGYDQVPVSGQMPAAPVFPMADREIYLRHQLGDQLAAKGFYEILTNSLVSREAAGESGVGMKNPLSEDHAALRSTLLPSGLEVLAFNRNRKAADLRYFEFGKIYGHAGEQFTETLQLGIWMAGNRNEDHWQEKSNAVEIFTLSSVVEWLTAGLQQPISREAYSDSELSWGWQLKAGKEILGRYGRVRAELTRKADLSLPVYYLEIDWKRLYKTMGKNVPEFRELPKFPAVRRDLSLTIPAGLSWQRLQEVIRSVDPGLIRSVDLFDVYTAPEAAGGRTSYSLSVVLQDPRNTLQEDRIAGVMEKILNKVTEQTGAILRA